MILQGAKSASKTSAKMLGIKLSFREINLINLLSLAWLKDIIL